MNFGIMLKLHALNFGAFYLKSRLELQNFVKRHVEGLVEESSLLKVESCRHEDNVCSVESSACSVHHELFTLLDKDKVFLFEHIVCLIDNDHVQVEVSLRHVLRGYHLDVRGVLHYFVQLSFKLCCECTWGWDDGHFSTVVDAICSYQKGNYCFTLTTSKLEGQAGGAVINSTSSDIVLILADNELTWRIFKLLRNSIHFVNKAHERSIVIDSFAHKLLHHSFLIVRTFETRVFKQSNLVVNLVDSKTKEWLLFFELVTNKFSNHFGHFWGA